MTAWLGPARRLESGLPKHLASAEDGLALGAPQRRELAFARGHGVGEQRGILVLREVREGGERIDGQYGVRGKWALVAEEALGRLKAWGRPIRAGRLISPGQ
ncbi:MAG: hypothetical protein IPL40_11930 [Proteobacteria bacterium]|nr:hypothetical protein [Pseudomonadota bacterium]